MSAHKVKQLGVPKFIAAGSYDMSGTRYRFMVMERFGSDLQKLFEANSKQFSRKVVLQLAVRLVSEICSQKQPLDRYIIDSHGPNFPHQPSFIH